MKLSAAEILSEATKALRVEYTLGFVPTSSSKGSPVHTFAGDAFAFKSRESFIRGHVRHLSTMGAKVYRCGRTGTVLKIIGCKSIGWLPFGSCSSEAEMKSALRYINFPTYNKLKGILHCCIGNLKGAESTLLGK